MPLTAIDPVAALIVVDLQKGVVGLPTIEPSAPIIDKAAGLARAFRESGHPVVFVHVDGGPAGRTDAPARGALPADWAEFVDALGIERGDRCVTKRSWGAFGDPSLADDLRALGVTQVFLLGIATSLGVESTAREAHSLGFHVVLVTDAMTDLDAAAHRNSIDWIFPMLGETCQAADVVAALKRRP